VSKPIQPVLRAADPRPSADVVAFPSGRVVQLHNDPGDRLTVTDPHGRFEIAIRFTEAGPVLDVSAVALHLRASAAVVLECDSLDVRAREHITLDSRGDLVERVGGDHRVEVEGAASMSASSLTLHADDGAVEIAATEDTRIDARRIVMHP
jgi:hypothetical protein